MKQFFGFDKDIGSDGKVGGGIGVEADNFQVAVRVTYPISKVIEPATKALDALLVKIEGVIPGDWDKAILEKVKVEYKEELVKLISEKVEDNKPVSAPVAGEPKAPGAEASEG